MATITLESFDDGIWLLGGRDQLPAAALRAGTGTNPVSANSLRQRWGNVQLSTIPSISLFNFFGDLYSLDASGNFYHNFAAIKTGLTNGNRASFSKAPPHFGSGAYLFVAGTGSQFKVDSTGAVTNWGIHRPDTGMTAATSFQPISISINTLNSTAGLTAVDSATIATDNTNFITGTGSVLLDLDGKNHGGFKGTAAVNLMPPGSSNDDFIQLYVLVNDPTLLKGIVISFDLGTGYHSDYYYYNVPFSSFIAVNNTNNPNQAAGLDVASGVITSQPFTNPPPVGPIPLGQEFITAYKTYLNRKLGSDPTPSYFKPSQGSQQGFRAGGTPVTTAGTGWWLIQVPRGAFTRIGGNASLTWANVSGFKITAQNTAQSSRLAFNFDDLRFIGGVGMIGTYQYLATFANGTTGSYSQPTGASDSVTDKTATPFQPVVVTNDSRMGITLGNFPTSSDAQVNQLILWRTMGNGGIFYKLATLTSPFPSTFLDYNSDYIGLGPNPADTANPIADWMTATVYPDGSLILPTVGNTAKNVFASISHSGSGTSGGVEPNWNSVPLVGQTIVDNAGGNQITWQNLGTTLSLGIEPLLQVNILPPATVTQCIYFKGTMFLCGDTATGARGRIYYSSPGYAEGVAGYTDITNDDDPTTGFAVFNNNLYVFTQKAVWLVVDISTNPLIPAFTVVQQMGAPGCTAPYSIVPTPNALIYQGPDGLYAFDGYYAEAVVPQILPLFRGETVEIYGPIGTIIAATYGRDEYWFSDGNGATWALNVMPSSRAGKKEVSIAVRQHSTFPSTALFFYQNPLQLSSSIVYAGWNATTAKLEVAGTIGTDPGGIVIPLAWRTRSRYSGSKYTYKVQRGFFDINPAGATLNAYISLDGVDYFLGTITGTTRQKFDFTFNKSGSTVGLYLTNNAAATTGLIELFFAGIETDDSGREDMDK